jgi:hypothetical protein
MGKYSLLLSLGVMSAITILSFQGMKTDVDTAEGQATRQGEVLARQIARSGYNSILSYAHQVTTPEKDISKIVSQVDTVRGEYEGGTYEAWIEQISPTAYRAVSVGRLTVAGKVVKHTMGDGYARNMPDPPEIEKPSQLKLNYVGSGRTGYCSAVYLQRTVPSLPDDEQPEPELIYAPSDENRSPEIYDETMESGTKINFILGVYEKRGDWDTECGGREGEQVELGSGYYDQTFRSFKRDTDSEMRALRETGRSIVEETESSEKEWRVAFEGYAPFTEAQLWDIKDNGYPENANVWELPSIWEENQTYGGDGWEKGNDGLREFEEGYRYRPDFNDEVFTATTLDVNPS